MIDFNDYQESFRILVMYLQIFNHKDNNFVGIYAMPSVKLYV